MTQKVPVELDTVTSHTYMRSCTYMLAQMKYCGRTWWPETATTALSLLVGPAALDPLELSSITRSSDKAAIAAVDITMMSPALKLQSYR